MSRHGMSVLAAALGAITPPSMYYSPRCGARRKLHPVGLRQELDHCSGRNRKRRSRRDARIARANGLNWKGGKQKHTRYGPTAAGFEAAIAAARRYQLMDGAR